MVKNENSLSSSKLPSDAFPTFQCQFGLNETLMYIKFWKLLLYIYSIYMYMIDTIHFKSQISAHFPPSYLENGLAASINQCWTLIHDDEIYQRLWSIDRYNEHRWQQNIFNFHEKTFIEELKRGIDFWAIDTMNKKQVNYRHKFGISN